MDKMEKIAIRLKASHTKKKQDKSQSLRDKAFEAFQKQNFTRAQPNIIQPEYKEDKRLNSLVETNIPPKEVFMELGHNKSPNDESKHYRKYFDTELEKTNLFNEQPFETYEIKRTKEKKKSSGLFSLFTSSKTTDSDVDTSKNMGYFKGIVNVYSDELRKLQIEENE